MLFVHFNKLKLFIDFKHEKVTELNYRVIWQGNCFNWDSQYQIAKDAKARKIV